MVEQGFGESIASRRRYVDELAMVELARFPGGIGKLLLEGDTREYFEKLLSRVASTGFDAKVECWVHDGGDGTTDLFCFDRLGHSHPTSNVTN
ncbi:hypothetical protein JCM18750_20620 [Halostagnicola bangensis]